MTARTEELGFTLIEMLVTLALVGLVTLPLILTFRTSRQNQAMRASAESFADNVKGAHIFSRETKDKKAWGIKNEDNRKYAIVSGKPDNFEVVYSYSLESGVHFSSGFALWFGPGTGTLEHDEIIDIEADNGQSMRVSVSSTGIVEVTR